MTSTLGGDDPLHDLSAAEKDRKERELRSLARNQGTSSKQRTKLINRANEISRKKSRRAHQDQN